MAVITLLTDFGERDYYVSMFKGDLLTACPSVQIVDISHAIPSYDINTAAFFLKNVYHRFPPNTIHIVRVYEQGIENQKLLAAKYHNYFFIAPDNGILTLAFDEKPELIVEIDVMRQAKLHTPEDHYCRVVKEIIFNHNIGNIGKATNHYVEKRNILPVLEQRSISGRVIYVDSFGNVITNIKREEIERKSINNKFKIQYGRSDFVDKIVTNYADVPMGYTLGRFNTIGYLEVSIHCGNASQLLGLDIGSPVKIWIE